MAHQLAYSGDKHLGLSDIRQKQQEKLNEDAKIAEQIRKEKERQKLKEKLERYERLGWKIFGPTCEPRQEYRIENAKAKMDQNMAQARDKMQIFHDKKAKAKSEKQNSEKEELENERKKEMLRVLKMKNQTKLKQNSEKEELENERKKEMLRVLKMKNLQKTREESGPIIVPKILKLRPSLLNTQAPENPSEKNDGEDTQKTKEEMDKEMKASRLKLQEKLNEAARQNFQA